MQVQIIYNDCLGRGCIMSYQCNSCGKRLPIGVPFYSINLHREKETENRSIEILEAETLFVYCDECFRQVTIGPFAVAPQPSTVIREREVIKEVVMIPCAHCGNLMPQTSIFCPNCGARRKA